MANIQISDPNNNLLTTLQDSDRIPVGRAGTNTPNVTDVATLKATLQVVKAVLNTTDGKLYGLTCQTINGVQVLTLTDQPIN